MRKHHFSFLKVLFLVIIGSIGLSAPAQNQRQKINFNSDWQFCNQEDLSASTDILPTQDNFSFSNWQTISLPHTAKVEPLVIKEPWVGVSWYKKDFGAKSEWKNKVVSIEFEAAMQVADVWLNGKHLLTHSGGYLPFTIDISKEIDYTKKNRLVVKTDNHDNAEVPPGKPIKNLDFLLLQWHLPQRFINSIG